MATRGERNNNPGNLRKGSPWQGLSRAQPDADFCTFDDPDYGIRALCKVLLLYGMKGVDTVAAIIARWAPSNENNTSAYVAAVAASMKVDPNIHLDVRQYSQLYPLVDAIIHHENGRNIYPRTTMDAGLALAGVTP
jgi:hypothetical protein